MTDEAEEAWKRLTGWEKFRVGVLGRTPFLNCMFEFSAPVDRSLQRKGQKYDGRVIFCCYTCGRLHVDLHHGCHNDVLLCSR